ncbi:adenine phosphoribosyltransferase [Parvularcula bermudensis HTCC2503]|uniref:adenine phosphoribosyltransferase n=2 Tax=Parvularcula TaxID=208215 RepID=E0TIB3_PARBH|nr:adenine phosphoribosyltransferase [Parvularcula bermudensis HTCC2503]
MADGPAFAESVARLASPVRAGGYTAIAGIEARGLVFGAAVAAATGLGFVPIRKPGKLPATVLRESYELEYGRDALEIHHDAIAAEAKVFLIDDLLATGGTLLAAATLIERLGGTVGGAGVVVDLPDLGGSRRLAERGIPLHTLVCFEGE